MLQQATPSSVKKRRGIQKAARLQRLREKVREIREENEDADMMSLMGMGLMFFSMRRERPSNERLLQMQEMAQRLQRMLETTPSLDVEDEDTEADVGK